MQLFDHETEHLGCNDSGLVCLLRDEVSGLVLAIGQIEEDPPWPRWMCGPEPEWFEIEKAELLALWEDARRYGRDCREQVESDYRRAKGGS